MKNDFIEYSNYFINIHGAYEFEVRRLDNSILLDSDDESYDSYEEAVIAAKEAIDAFIYS